MKQKMHNGAIKPLYQFARELRNNATFAETLLWGFLKTRPGGCKFRRQHPYSTYILDFYCHSLKLAIEVDGSIHDLPDVKANDKIREDDLRKEGLEILRFTNLQIETNFEEVRILITNFITNNKNESR